MEYEIVLPPEWYPQDAILMAWPDEHTDWHDDLSEVQKCYLNIITQITRSQKVVLLCRDKKSVYPILENKILVNLILVEASYNDTWTRDYGPVTAIRGDKLLMLDFQFNGWGKKFEASGDNTVSRQLFNDGVFSNKAERVDHSDFVLEGGSIESDGKGTLLTTSHCLLAPNRNQPMTLQEIEEKLKHTLYINNVLWLESGYLEGDDTDGHIDTLARFCNENTIAYVGCDDVKDNHFHELKAMEEELKNFKNKDGQLYQLIRLPMADPQFDENDKRLPATYANFLILNEMVLIPFYDSPKDQLALQLLQKAFPDRKVKGVDCNALIRQHGSLHCVTMQLPKGSLNVKLNENN